MLEDGVWRTIGGRRVFIKKGQSLSSAMKESGKFDNKKEVKQKSQPKYETSEEHRNRLIEEQEKYRKYEEERDKKLKELYAKENYKDEEFISIMDEYYKKINELGQFTIYDEKNDRYIKVDNADVFTDENKRYKGNQKINVTPEEEIALTNYTSEYGDGSYSTVNRYLYENQVNMFTEKSRVEKSINTISNAMEKNEIGGNYQFYRGIEPDRLNNAKLEDAVVKINKAVKKGGAKNLDKYVNELYSHIGDEIENKGFLSTSTSIDPNYVQRGATLVINTKSTDRAIDVKGLSKYGGKQDTQFAFLSKGGIQKESEVLYDKDTDLIIKDVAITKDGVFFLCDTKQKNKSK